jgi:hypothetical protein
MSAKDALYQREYETSALQAEILRLRQELQASEAERNKLSDLFVTSSAYIQERVEEHKAEMKAYVRKAKLAVDQYAAQTRREADDYAMQTREKADQYALEIRTAADEYSTSKKQDCLDTIHRCLALSTDTLIQSIQATKTRMLESSENTVDLVYQLLQAGEAPNKLEMEFMDTAKGILQEGKREDTSSYWRKTPALQSHQEASRETTASAVQQPIGKDRVERVEDIMDKLPSLEEIMAEL